MCSVLEMQRYIMLKINVLEKALANVIEITVLFKSKQIFILRKAAELNFEKVGIINAKIGNHKDEFA